MFLDIRWLVIIFLALSVNGTTSQNPVLSFTVQSADNLYTVNITDQLLSQCFCGCDTSVCTSFYEGPQPAGTCGEQDGIDQTNTGSTCFMCKTSGVDMVSCTRHSSCDESPHCILTSESCNRKIIWDKGNTVECVSADVPGQNSAWACQCFNTASTDSPSLAPEATMTPSNSTAVVVGPSGESWTSSTTIGVAVGVSVGVTMIVVALIGLILWRRRQRRLMERPAVPLPKSYLLNVEKQTPQKQFTSGGLHNVIAVEPSCVNAGYDDRGDGGDGLIYEIVTDPASHKASGQDQRWTTLHNNNNNNVNTPSSNMNNCSNNTRVKNIKNTRDTNIKSTPNTNIGDRLDTRVELNKQQVNGSLSDTTTNRVSVGPDSDRVYEEISPTDNDGSSLGRSPAPTTTTTTTKTHSGGDITISSSLYKNCPARTIQNDIPEMSDVENRQDSVYFELEKEEVLDDDDVDDDVEKDKKVSDEDSEDDKDHLYSNV